MRTLPRFGARDGGRRWLQGQRRLLLAGRALATRRVLAVRAGRRIGALVGLALAISGAVSGHELWIEPGSFRPQPGELLPLRLRLGGDGKVEPVPRRAQRIEEFYLQGPAGRTPVLGAEGTDPAGVVRLAVPGLYAIGYRGRFAALELPAEKFEAYLKEEGLDKIIARRRELGESARPGRERYARSLKALLVAGDGKREGVDQPLGLPLELVPETDPFAPSPADEPLRFRLLLFGEPLDGALVKVFPLGAPEPVTSARSDGAGRLALAFSGGGPWLLTAVHMERAGEGAQADWESWWTSLTFAREPEGSGPPVAPWTPPVP